jgi:hypothetical protein
VRIGIHETQRLARLAAGGEETGKHDAAVAAEDDAELTVSDRRRDAFGQRARVRDYLIFVSRPTCRPYEILVSRWRDVSEVGRAEARNQPALP